MDKFMDNGYELEVRLKDRVIACVSPLWKRIDGIEKRIQDVVNTDTFEASPDGFVAAEHFPKAFAEHVMISSVLSAQN